MTKSYYSTFPWQNFMEFTSLRADRFIVLKAILEKSKLKHDVAEIAGNKHFIVKAPSIKLQKATERIPVILTAHYDRAAGSPGANDNSAAVFVLIEAAIKLTKKGETNWLIIFTDKEELLPGESILKQGSYTLAKGIKNIKMDNSMIFCFDAVGTGDSIIISTTLDYLLNRKSSGRKIEKSLTELRNKAYNTAKEQKNLNAYFAPLPFSEDAGFFRAGLAAQTITVLPQKEYLALNAELKKNPDFGHTLINAEAGERKKSKAIPQTWLTLNSPKDNHLRLTPENFRFLARYAEALCS